MPDLSLLMDTELNNYDLCEGLALSGIAMFLFFSLINTSSHCIGLSQNFNHKGKVYLLIKMRVRVRFCEPVNLLIFN